MDRLSQLDQDRLRAWIDAASSGCQNKRLFYTLYEKGSLEWAWKNFRAMPGNNSYWIDQINKLLRSYGMDV